MDCSPAHVWATLPRAAHPEGPVAHLGAQEGGVVDAVALIELGEQIEDHHLTKGSP